MKFICCLNCLYCKEWYVAICPNGELPFIHNYYLDTRGIIGVNLADPYYFRSRRQAITVIRKAGIKIFHEFSKGDKDSEKRLQVLKDRIKLKRKKYDIRA